MPEQHKRRKYQVFVAPGAKGLVEARAAVDLINKMLGRNVATIAFNRENADVVVRAGNPRGEAGGYFWERKGKDRITIDERLLGAEGASSEYITALMAHEIGHGMGLEHVGAQMNLMNPEIVGTRLSEAQREQVLNTFRSGGFLPGDRVRMDSEGANRPPPTVVEYRKVMIDYEINVPNAGAFRRAGDRRIFMNQQYQPRLDREFIEAIRRELIRTGSRNPDIFGGRA